MATAPRVGLLPRRSFLSPASAVLALAVLPACFPLFNEEKATYPSNWAPLQQAASTAACPRIEGIYIDGGEYKAPGSGRPCDYQLGECQSLLFALLYTFHEQPFKGSAPGFFAANRRLEVRIEQPSGD